MTPEVSKSSSVEPSMRQFNMRLPDETRTVLEAAAFVRRIPLTELIRQSLDQLIEEHTPAIREYAQTYGLEEAERFAGVLRFLDARASDESDR